MSEGGEGGGEEEGGEGGCSRVFLDVSVGDSPAGRIIIRLDGEKVMPKTAESFRQLVTGERASVDQMLSYKGCSFDFQSSYIRGGAYKYSHPCKGKGRNIYGRSPFVEKDAMMANRHKTPGVGGGDYYGVKVDLEDQAVSSVVCVPVQGPGYGQSRFYIVRVRESPNSMRERLLVNMAVIGILEGGEEVLEEMATGYAPPTIVDCGML